MQLAFLGIFQHQHIAVTSAGEGGGQKLISNLDLQEPCAFGKVRCFLIGQERPDIVPLPEKHAPGGGICIVYHILPDQQAGLAQQIQSIGKVFHGILLLHSMRFRRELITPDSGKLSTDFVYFFHFSEESVK